MMHLALKKKNQGLHNSDYTVNPVCQSSFITSSLELDTIMR